MGVTAPSSSSTFQVVVDNDYTNSIKKIETTSSTTTELMTVSATNKIDTNPITTLAPLVFTSKLTETYPEALLLSQAEESSKNQKINSLSISFDSIDPKNDALKAVADTKSFQVKIINRTEIFKGKLKKVNKCKCSFFT